MKYKNKKPKKINSCLLISGICPKNLSIIISVSYSYSLHSSSFFLCFLLPISSLGIFCHFFSSIQYLVWKYEFYATTTPRVREAREGTAFAIKKDIKQKKLNIRTTIQVVALEIYLIGKWKITVCSIYLPTTDQVTEADMRDLLEQLITPMILLGDFNAHNPLWESENVSTKGNDKKILDRYNLLCINK